MWNKVSEGRWEREGLDGVAVFRTTRLSGGTRKFWMIERASAGVNPIELRGRRFQTPEAAMKTADREWPQSFTYPDLADLVDKRANDWASAGHPDDMVGRARARADTLRSEASRLVSAPDHSKWPASYG